MEKLKLFSREQVGNAPLTGRQYSRPDSLSLVSRQSVLAMLLVLLTTVFGVGNAWAEEVTGTINFGSASGSTAVSGTSVTGDDSQGNEWTITTVMSENSFTQNASYSQIGASKKPATSITFTTTLDAAQTITSFSAKFGGFSGTAGTISLKVGETEVGSGSLNGTNDVTVTNTDATQSGTVLTVTVTGIAKGVKAYYISYTYSNGGEPAPSLDHIAITGTPSKTYEQGQSFDPTGLTVTAYYDDDTNADVTGDVEWSFDPATFTVAGENQSVKATATYQEKEASETYNEITVTEHVVTPGEYTINLNNILYGVSTGNNAAEQSASQKDITVVSGCTSSASSKTYYGTGHIRYYADSYLHISVPSGYVIKFIVFTASGTWNGNITANTGTYTNETKTWSGSAQEVDFSFAAQNRASSIKVTYAATAKSAVTIDDAIENGSVDVTGAADLSTVAEGTELTLSNTPVSGYKFGSYTVYKTGDTETTITVTNNKFTMPAFDVTVSATFEETKTLTGITLTGEYPTVFLTGDAFSHEGMTVTANYDDENSADVTASATFTGYDMSAAGAQTVTVSYTEGATVTKTYNITVKDAYTVAEILPLVPAQNAGSLATKVKGYISQIDQYNSSYNSITYWISDDGKTTSDKLEVYSGKNVGNTNFSSIDDLEVGDFVTITGNVKTHTNGVKEFDKNNYIITGGRIQKGAVTTVTVSDTPTKTEYAANEDFDPAGLVVTGTYANGYVGVITDGITWGNDLAEGKVTENTTVHVTATVSEITSPAYDVPVTVAAKTLVSIAVGTDAYTIYTGEALPQPVVTATFSEGEPEDVSAFAVYDSENVFNTATIDNPDPQTITVSYTFGGATQTATYTVSVKDYANANDAPYTVTEALHIITAAIGNTESAREIVVAGTVSAEKVSNYKNRYKISDGVNELLVYNGKGFNDEAFTDANYPKVGDVMVVKGKVIYFNNNTPEFASGKSYPLSQVRPAELTIENVTGFEVGADDLAVADLTITKDGEGAVTLVSSNNTDAVTIVDGKLHAVAAGTATITANLAATTNDDELNYAAASATFDVTVITAQVKYAITFDGNGADGGSAPEAIADKAAGAEVTLPANSYTKTGGYTFNGWKVFYVDGESVEHEVTVTNGAFTMPASAVTIQAQWAEVSEWALKYTSNVTLTAGTGAQAAKVRFTADGEQYDAVKAGTSKAGGSITVTVPAQATKLHLHVAGWTGENPTISITAPEGVTVTPASISATEDEGMNSNSPFTLENDPVDQYLVLSLSGNTEEIELTFSTDAGNKRFALYGVNQEGGVLPVLESIKISGDLNTKTGYKAGDALDLDGLTVSATYSLGGIAQTPVDITDKLGDGLTLTYDPLEENQTEVTITATYEGKSDDIVITGLEAVASADPKIYVDKFNVNFGTVAPNASVDAQTITVTLTNVANATATLGGTNPEAFNITPASPAALTTSGDITISVVSTANVGTYSATITISDNAEAAPSKVVNLSLTVEDVETAVSPTSKWVAAEAADLADGAEVLITGVKDAVTYAMGADRGNNRYAVAGTLNEGVFTPGENTMSFTLVAQGDGTFALRTSNGKYLYAGGTGSNNYLNTKAYAGELDANAKWNITISSIVATSTNRNDMRFNYNNNNPALISCYQSTSTYPAVALYVPKQDTPTPATPDYTRNVTNGNYGTICLPQAGTIEGATLFDIASFENGMIYMDEVGSTMEAGKPYIFQATADQLNVTYTSATVEENAGSANGLHGFYNLENENDTQDVPMDGKSYILYQNAYWLVSGRAAYIANYRAYIVLDDITPKAAAPGRRRVAMAVHGEQVATGMDNVQGDNVQCTKVMINGQLFILRGEKMYDVAGKLVK